MRKAEYLQAYTPVMNLDASSFRGDFSKGLRLLKMRQDLHASILPIAAQVWPSVRSHSFGKLMILCDCLWIPIRVHAQDLPVPARARLQSPERLVPHLEEAFPL